MFTPEEGEPVGSINRAALGIEDEAEEDVEEGEEDLSKLLKTELVERAEAAGIDSDGMTKAELVEVLEGLEEG